jgi:hypothetical protein
VYICSENKEKPHYEPGLERWSHYKTIWSRHWVDFAKIYPHKYEKIFGPLDEEKIHEVKKLIRCGKFQNGFQRHTCPECNTVLVVPFTCKSRLCLSCYRKRLFGWSLNLSHIMNTTLHHNHVTFTIPGTISRVLFERKYEPDKMIKLASNIYRNVLISSAKLKGKEYQPGIMATLHKSGNSLNYNPHVHLVGTGQIVDTGTGEVIEVPYIPYGKVHHIWKAAFLKHLLKQNVISSAEYTAFNDRYSNGFHVYFQPITGDNNEVLFRTSEYIATGYFHNSQITAVDHAKRTVTFKYRKWVDRKTGKKLYSTKTMDIYLFMASMLFFLPGKNRKMIRYYGIYSGNIEKKLDMIDRCTWAKAVEHSFNKDPVKCPECTCSMKLDTVFSFFADNEIKKLVKTHVIVKGYFIPYKKQVVPP